MPVKKTPENDPFRIVTHENGFREWIGTPTEEQENWILSHAVGVKSFSSARSRSAESAEPKEEQTYPLPPPGVPRRSAARKGNEDDSTYSKQTEEK